MDIRRITTYSLLAHINNSSVGINDLSEIFIPLVKRVIARMETEDIHKGGSLDEIKVRVDTYYRFDMPFPLLKKIVKKIAEEQNKNDVVNFAFHKDGSFIIKNFTFSEYEEVMAENEQEILLLNEAYENYLKISGYDVKKQPSIFNFLDSNRHALSEYFATKKVIQPEIEYGVQANFVNSIKDVPKLFNVLRKVYLGSIITSYLEVDYGDLKSNLEFVLDTNFLISLVDLNSKEATHTCRKIIEICKRLNYRLTVLDLTIEETKSLIYRTAETYESTFLPKKIDPESIYNACDRRNLGITDLENIAGNLEETLQREFGIGMPINTEKVRNKAKYSKEYERYLEIRTSKLSAIHDATAITYVRDKRGRRGKRFEEANSWFVTNTSHSIIHFKEDEFLPEIIRAEDLVNLLWLTNPNVKAAETIEIGLTRMISCAIENSLPSARVIKELDENIQKYGKERLKPEDIIRVANKIANKTLLNLDELNKQAKESPEAFIKSLELISSKQKAEEDRKQKEVKGFLIKLQEESEGKIQTFRKEIKESHEHELGLISNQFDKKLKEETEAIRDQKLISLKRTFLSLDKIHDAIVKKSSSFATSVLLSIALAPILVVLILWSFIGWDIFESWTFLLSFIPWTVSLIYWFKTQKEFSFANMWGDIKGYRYKKLIHSSNFELSSFEELRKEIENENINYNQTLPDKANALVQA